MARVSPVRQHLRPAEEIGGPVGAEGLQLSLRAPLLQQGSDSSDRRTSKSLGGRGTVKEGVTEDEFPPALRGGRIEAGDGTRAWARDTALRSWLSPGLW